MGIVKEAVQNLVVYLILVTVILNLVKGSSYKKYIELFTGLVLILILLTPVTRLFAGENVLEKHLEDNQYLFEMQDSAEFIYEAEEDTKQKLLELYSEKVEERIKQLGERNSITVERVKTSLSTVEEGFGTVEKIEVWTDGEEKKAEFKELLKEAFALSDNKVLVK